MDKWGQIQPTDIVLFWSDTMTTLMERIRLHGLRKALKRKIPTNVGMVIEIHGRKMVVVVGKELELVPLKNIEDRIVSVSRHVAFANEDKRSTANIFIYNEYQNSVEGDPNLLIFSKKASPKHYKAFFVYVVHANFYPFEAKIAKGNMSFNEIFTTDHGFIKV